VNTPQPNGLLKRGALLAQHLQGASDDVVGVVIGQETGHRANIHKAMALMSGFAALVPCSNPVAHTVWTNGLVHSSMLQAGSSTVARWRNLPAIGGGKRPGISPFSLDCVSFGHVDMPIERSLLHSGWPLFAGVKPRWERLASASLRNPCAFAR
jgi:hypothetical protein